MSTRETQATYLVIGADGSDINDGIGIIKERRPCVPLSTRPADIIQLPLHCTVATMIDNESVLRNPNGLYPCVKNIIDGRHVAVFGNPINLIEEAVRYRR